MSAVFMSVQGNARWAFNLLPLAIGMALATSLLIALTWGPMRRQGLLRRRLAGLAEVHPPLAGPAPGRGPLLAGLLAALGSALTRSGLLSVKTLTELESTLSAAGIRGGRALPIFVGAKVLLLGIAPLACLGLLRALGATGSMVWLAPTAAACAGVLLPDLVLRFVRRRYLAAVERALPDALDLLVICAEAGLALEHGIERVAFEMRASSAACATELATTHDELLVIGDRRTALHNMGRRTGLATLRRLAGTLSQALQYGTPLSQALRTLAAELRAEALTRFEARAARLPVLLTLPMIMLILPCVFLVVVGPAALSIMASLLGR